MSQNELERNLSDTTDTTTHVDRSAIGDTPADESLEISANLLNPGDESGGETGSVVNRPPDLPEKFWDAETGTARVDALARSYVELEKRLGRSILVPDADDAEGWNRFFDAAGRPGQPEDYHIEPRHPMVTPDGEVNRLLHAAGFSQRQAELVYELAADRLVPVIEDAVADMQATRERERLVDHFGGEERWRNMSTQLRQWAQTRLDGDAFEALSRTYDGVLAMAEMMRRQEPSLSRDGSTVDSSVSENELHSLVRDPRYWRDRDPEFIARVTEGYRRLYSG
ncbi:MAG: hypothetical protein R3C97_01570 [Geminicoccaceae bacterium]